MHNGQATTSGHSVPKKPVKKTSDEEFDDMLQSAKDDWKKDNAERAAALKASHETVADASSAPDASATPAEAAPGGKKKKKTSRLAYTDNSESPEEKLAKRAEHAFERDNASQ
jgi:hypothetical protein